MENQYNLQNYRLDNKKLPVGLPGEKKAQFYSKNFEDREKEDNRNLAKYVEEMYGGKEQLKNAIKQSYQDAS